MHDMPDFIVRLKTTPAVHLIVETKGFDPLEDVKRAAAERWVAAVNADGTCGKWAFALAKKPVGRRHCSRSYKNRRHCSRRDP